MVTLAELEWAAVAGLFFLTLGAIIASLLWGFLWARKVPAEVLQLRIFENQRPLERILLFMAVGLLAGLVDGAPALLHVPVPTGWAFGWTLIWSVCTIYALILAFRVFRGRSDSRSIGARDVA
jgi:hypothetical protein